MKKNFIFIFLIAFGLLVPVQWAEGSWIKKAMQKCAKVVDRGYQPIEKGFRKVRNAVLYPVNKVLLWLENKANENDDIRELMKHGTVEVRYGVTNNEATLQYTPKGSGQTFKVTIKEGDDPEAVYAEFTEKARKKAEELKKAREDLDNAKEEKSEATKTFNASLNTFEQSEHGLLQSQKERTNSEQHLTHNKSENKSAQNKVDKGHEVVDATRKQTLEAREQSQAQQTQYVLKAEKSIDENELIAYSISLVEHDVIPTPLATDAQMVMPSPYAGDETCHVNPRPENLLNDVKSLEDFELGMEKVYGAAHASGIEGVMGLGATSVVQDVMLGIAGAIAKHGNTVIKGAKAAGGAILVDEVAFDGAISDCMNALMSALADYAAQSPSESDLFNVEFDLANNPIYEAEMERQKSSQLSAEPPTSPVPTAQAQRPATPKDVELGTPNLQYSASIPQDPIAVERVAPPVSAPNTSPTSNPPNTHTIVVSMASILAEMDSYLEESENAGPMGIPLSPPPGLETAPPHTQEPTTNWASIPHWEKESSPVRVSDGFSYGEAVIGDDTSTGEDEEALNPTPTPSKPPVPPYDLWSRDDEMATLEQDVPPAPYSGIWTEEEWEYLETIGSEKLTKVEAEFLSAVGHSVIEWENSFKPKKCLFSLEGGPFRLVKTLALLCKPNKKLNPGDKKELNSCEVNHMPAYASIKNAINNFYENDKETQESMMIGYDKSLNNLIRIFNKQVTKFFWRESGPSVLMSYADHTKTKSYQNSHKAREYRDMQSQLIYEGRYKEAIELDKKDLRDKFGDKYEKGIWQMDEYVKILETTILSDNISK